MLSKILSSMSKSDKKGRKAEESSWDELERKVLEKKRKQENEKKGKGKEDSLVKIKGLYSFLIKSRPNILKPIPYCKNHHIRIEGKHLELHCETSLGDDIMYRFLLEDPHIGSILILHITEEIYLKMLLKLEPGHFVIKNKTKFKAGLRHEYPMKRLEVKKDIV